MADVEVNIDPIYKIEANLGIDYNGPAQKFFVDTCADHMDKYVPARPDLNLASSVRTTTDEIIYPGPYAHYLYEGKVMGPNIPIKDKSGRVIRWFSKAPKYYTGADLDIKTEVHSLATSHWAEKMWSAEKVDILKEMADYFKSRTKRG